MERIAVDGENLISNFDERQSLQQRVRGDRLQDDAMVADNELGSETLSDLL